jgi:hypothetical protein
MRPFFRGKETLHGLHNDFLVAYITKLVISIISTWLTEEVPEKPEDFKPIFLQLVSTSLTDIIEF